MVCRENIGLGGLVLGSRILYLKGMRTFMFQLSGFYCRVSEGSSGFRGFRRLSRACSKRFRL